jgi:hypothetical protein
MKDEELAKSSPSPVLVSYPMLTGSQAVMDVLQADRGEHGASSADNRRRITHGGKTWNALTAETRRQRAENTKNFMTGREGTMVSGGGEKTGRSRVFI